MPPGNRATRLLTILGSVAREGRSGMLQLAGDAAGALVFARGELSSLKAPQGAASAAWQSAAAARDQATLRQEIRRLAAGASTGGDNPRFLDQPAAAGATCLHGVNAGDLALEVARDIADTEWLRAHIVGSPAEKISMATAAPAILPRLGLGASGGFLLSRADGSLTLQQILEASPYGEVQTLQSLCALRSVGMITSKADQKSTAPRPQASGAQDHATPPLEAVAQPAPSAPGAQSRPSAPAPASPAASTGPALTADQEKERRELLSKAREVVSQASRDYYTILGVERTAPDARIRQSYYRLARLYHPDRLRKPHLEDIHRELEEMFAAITVAYTTLSRSESRAAHDKETSRSTVKKDPAAERLAAGREAFMRGRKALEGGEVYEAMRLFETAVEMDPAKAEYLLYLGRTEAHNPRWKKRAEEHFLKAIEMGPSAPAPYLELAKLYKSGGLERKAIEMCKQVLKWDPDNLTAQAMLAPKQDAAAAGLLKSIFKKS